MSRAQVELAETARGEELEQLTPAWLAAADPLLFGRVTSEGMAQHWPSAAGEIADRLNSIPKIVFSRTREPAGWNKRFHLFANVGAVLERVLARKRPVLKDGPPLSARREAPPSQCRPFPRFPR
jgi:hypothetical protein